jgi:hypothetical protein
MKIAVFSNLWPPVFIGWYEIGCSWIVEELKRRGHEVLLIVAHRYHVRREEGESRDTRDVEAIGAGARSAVDLERVVQHRDLEGMSVGLVTVASDRGGTGEAITDGETGFLFAGGDDRGLSEVLDRLDGDRGCASGSGPGGTSGSAWSTWSIRSWPGRRRARKRRWG